MLIAVPCFRDEANAFIREHHRHHGPVVGSVLTIACAKAATEGDHRICGVVTVGRPVARRLQDGWTAEVTRLATDGTPHACSFLYAAAWRAARAIGYHRLVTYILDSENGVSLKAAGWRMVGEAGGGSWSRKDRPRVDTAPTQRKIRWEAVCES